MGGLNVSYGICGWNDDSFMLFLQKDMMKVEIYSLY